MLHTIRKYRSARTEPEFKAYAEDVSVPKDNYTRQYGEPYVLDLYQPHVTIASGLENHGDYQRIESIVNKCGLSGIPLMLSELWLMQEQGIGGCWFPIRQFRLLG